MSGIDPDRILTGGCGGRRSSHNLTHSFLDGQQNDTPPANEKQALLEVVMREATFTLATKHQAPETA